MKGRSGDTGSRKKKDSWQLDCERETENPYRAGIENGDSLSLDGSQDNLASLEGLRMSQHRRKTDGHSYDLAIKKWLNGITCAGLRKDTFRMISIEIDQN